MKKHNYKNLKTEELFKKQKNLKTLIKTIIVIATLLLAADIYLLFQKDEVDSYVYLIGVLVPILIIWVSSIEKNLAKIKKELGSRGKKK